MKAHTYFMRRFLLMLLTLFVAHSLGAQNVMNVKFHQEGETIVLKYYMDTKADVTLHLSSDDGKTFGAPLPNVTGDVGKGVKSGYNTIIWRPLLSGTELDGDNFRFKVVVKQREKSSDNTFLLYTVPINPMQPIAGFTYARHGHNKLFGFYGSVTTCPFMPDKYVGMYETWVADGENDYNGKIRVAHHSLSVGSMLNIKNVVKIYLGLNMGVDATMYQTYNKELVLKNEARGLGFDAGAMVSIYGFTLSGGVASIADCFYAKVGVGYTIRMKK